MPSHLPFVWTTKVLKKCSARPAARSSKYEPFGRGEKISGALGARGAEDFFVREGSFFRREARLFFAGRRAATFDKS